MLKNSLAQEDREFDFTVAALHDKNKTYDHFDREFTDMIHSYDKLLDKFNAH